MKTNQCLAVLRGVVIFAAIVICASIATAGNYKVLHVFQWANYPTSLIIDGDGNLYGATAYGGINNSGVVFKLKHNSNGSFTYSVIHKFRGADGAGPGGLVMDAAGNLYGVTTWGVKSCRDNSSGCGAVFKLKPNSNGSWTETMLHNFSGPDGEDPDTGLFIDFAGNLYGATQFGGANSKGVVYKLSKVNGTWTETVLHDFDSTEGNPYALTLGADGNLYGATAYWDQGACTVPGYPCGFIFKLVPSSAGAWAENLIYDFTGGTMGDAASWLFFDSVGNLYGVSSLGGLDDCYPGEGCGLVWELTPDSSGAWTETVLYSFTGGNDGASPDGLGFDSAGNLYGPADLAGANGYGVVFKLTPGSGGWSEATVHSFGGYGILPMGSPVFDKSGNLYGITQEGNNNNGLVYQITP